jgi:3'-phosphoadenosine 5'-phosphosulfate sulfotransferase (PAPS reductase)/FAD synthetase
MTRPTSTSRLHHPSGPMFGDVDVTTPDLSAADLFASVSGGRDSTAMILHLHEIGVPFRAIHMDTGWEADQTYAYLDDVLRPLVLRLTGEPLQVLTDDCEIPAGAASDVARIEAMLGRPSAMVRRTVRKGMFASRLRRFCTQNLKIFPARAHYRAHHELTGRIPINAQGVRAEESAARARYPSWEPYDGDCAIWRPLLRWSAEDVTNIHRRHGVAWNPLYDLGASRVGCWPCIFARKGELRMIATSDPHRIDVLRELEAVVARRAAERAADNGAPAWFQSRYQVGGGDHHDGTCWPIDRAVDWAMTETASDLAAFARRHGLTPETPEGQGDLFADGVAEGCGRLAACELPSQGDLP